MTSPATNTKYIFVIFIAALIFSGLFYFRAKPSDAPESKNENIVKPSQLNFTDSNRLKSKPDTLSEKNESTTSQENPKPDIPSLTTEDTKIYSTFLAVLKSKNDNDPRIDRDLKTISRPIHEALIKFYDTLPQEDRNAKGLVVFLISRDLKTSNDVEFLKRTYEEPPCLSLEDCKKTAANEDPHHSSVNETTLIYPQLAGLYQLEQKLIRSPEILKDPSLRAGILALLKTAENFPVPQVQNRAAKIRAEFGL